MEGHCMLGLVIPGVQNAVHDLSIHPSLRPSLRPLLRLQKQPDREGILPLPWACTLELCKRASKA